MRAVLAEHREARLVGACSNGDRERAEGVRPSCNHCYRSDANCYLNTALGLDPKYQGYGRVDADAATGCEDLLNPPVVPGDNFPRQGPIQFP